MEGEGEEVGRGGRRGGGGGGGGEGEEVGREEGTERRLGIFLYVQLLTGRCYGAEPCTILAFLVGGVCVCVCVCVCMGQSEMLTTSKLKELQSSKSRC